MDYAPSKYGYRLFTTAVEKKRVVGIILLVAILSLFLFFNRLPKLDTVRGDLDAVTGPQPLFTTAVEKKRVVGIILLVAILSLFLFFNRLPKLDTVRGDRAGLLL